MGVKNTECLLAIDLAPEGVRVLDMIVRKGVPTVSAMATGTLAEGTIETLPERQLAALESILSTHRMRGRQCVATLPTNLVTTRSVMIDPGKPQAPEEQIKQTLQNILTYDARDLQFDFWNVAEDVGTNRTYEVLVVATQRSVVRRYLAGFTKMRLNCTHMDVAPCAMASLITKLSPEQESMVGTIVLGGSMGYFAVVHKHKVLFWRPFELSAAKQLISAPERVGDEISKCVSHMVGSLHMDAMTEIFVFGEGAQDRGFTSYLTTRFNLNVRSPSPFESLANDAMPSDLRTALQPTAATHYAAAVGLALQPTGGLNG